MYNYTSPTGWTALPPPVIGERGHFDHHTDMDAKVMLLEQHLSAQVVALATLIDTLENTVSALETRIATLEAKVP